MTPWQYVQTYLPFAQQTSAQTGLPVDFVLGQSALESGWGSSNAAVNGNNFFGLSPGGQLASYPSVGAGFQAFADLINGPRFSGWNGSTAGQIATSLNQACYTGCPNQNPNYGPSVQGATNTVDNVLGQLGLGSLIQSGQASGPGSSSSSSSGSGACQACQQVETWLAKTVGNAAGSWVFVVFGIVLVAGAVLLFAKDQGYELPPIPVPVE